MRRIHGPALRATFIALIGMSALATVVSGQAAEDDHSSASPIRDIYEWDQAPLMIQLKDCTDHKFCVGSYIHREESDFGFVEFIAEHRFTVCEVKIDATSCPKPNRCKPSPRSVRLSKADRILKEDVEKLHGQPFVGDYRWNTKAGLTAGGSPLLIEFLGCKASQSLCGGLVQQTIAPPKDHPDESLRVAFGESFALCGVRKETPKACLSALNCSYDVPEGVTVFSSNKSEVIPKVSTPRFPSEPTDEDIGQSTSPSVRPAF